jgi:hypothetical protein
MFNKKTNAIKVIKPQLNLRVKGVLNNSINIEKSLINMNCKIKNSPFSTGCYRLPLYQNYANNKSNSVTVKENAISNKQL